MQLDKNQYLLDLKRRGEENPKIKFEFQEVCLEIEKEFGKENKGRIWSLPYQIGITEDKMRRALKEFKSRRFNYFVWILTKVIK